VRESLEKDNMVVKVNARERERKKESEGKREKEQNSYKLCSYVLLTFVDLSGWLLMMCAEELIRYT